MAGRNRKTKRSGRSRIAGGPAPRAKAARSRERRGQDPGNARAPWRPLAARVHRWTEAVLHPCAPTEPLWRYLPVVLGLAFAGRAAVALSGDFVLHPDEIMQYLEPAHRLVFGSGVTFWEYFYGARSWLVPGLVAGILVLCDAVGLGQPQWYVGGVKLVFCALSLAIPAGMYVFARRHFGETAARVALLAGASWYELVGFAHKPMAEFVSTAPLMVLLAIAARPAQSGDRAVWPAALLAVLASAVRMQYTPLALVLLGVVFLRTRKKLRLVLAAAGFALAVGVFDAITWDAGLFHSYVTNLRFNLAGGEMRVGESPPWQFLEWLALAGAGLGVACCAGGLLVPRRYALLAALIAVILAAHSLQAHKEYRFVFVVVPLWLLIGADLVARGIERSRRGRPVGLIAAGMFAGVSIGGILNALPFQDRVYRAWSNETGLVRFVRDQDPVFAAYRYLAAAPGVSAVWHTDRPHYNLPGYYHLHRAIPFYDTLTQPLLGRDGAGLVDSVSHIVTEDADFSVSGYSLERTFGAVRILRRGAVEPEVRRWQEYRPVLVDDFAHRIMSRIDPRAPFPPADDGIRFAPVRSSPIPRVETTR